jgi:hypothetical protein
MSFNGINNGQIIVKTQGSFKVPSFWPLFIPLKLIYMTNNMKITEYIGLLGLKNYFIEFIIYLI